MTRDEWRKACIEVEFQTLKANAGFQEGKYHRGKYIENKYIFSEETLRAAAALAFDAAMHIAGDLTKMEQNR